MTFTLQENNASVTIKLQQIWIHYWWKSIDKQLISFTDISYVISYKILTNFPQINFCYKSRHPVTITFQQNLLSHWLWQNTYYLATYNFETHFLCYQWPHSNKMSNEFNFGFYTVVLSHKIFKFAKSLALCWYYNFSIRTLNSWKELLDLSTINKVCARNVMIIQLFFPEKAECIHSWMSFSNSAYSDIQADTKTEFTKVLN